MANVLDDLIEQQERDWRAGIRPASALQMDPNAGPGEITVAGAPQPLMPFTGWEQEKWAENQNPSQLRQDLNLDILRSKATQNRMAIEQAQTMNPIQSRLAQARLEATGAHQRYMEQQDADSLEQTANFLNYMADPNAPKPGTPEHRQYLVRGLLQNRAYLRTKGGQELSNEIAGTHDFHKMSAEELGKLLPEGMSPSSIHVGPNGVSVTANPIGTDTGKELGTKYGLKLGDFENPSAIKVGNVERSGSFKGSDTGGFVQIQRSNGKGSVIMPVAEFERLGGKFSAETTAARGGAQPDRQALAREALNDPNASEAHKAAARKILTGK